MKNFLYLFSAVLFISTGSYGQYYVNQNKVWAFGSRAGLDFSSGTPTAIRTAINSNEACASISDASGGLLFYTDGKKVWDRAHNVMTSGSSIAPYSFSSSTQGALIMQKPGSTTNYYVFSLEEFGALSTNRSHLVYCEVDMTLRSGMGDVVTSTIATPLDSVLSEKMTAIRGVGCQDIWLLYHSRDSSIFYARKVNASGISAPVVSRCGRVVRSRGSYGYFVGTMVASPNDSLIGMQVHSPGSNLQGTSLFDFDPATGIVSNCRDLDTVSVGYSCEFSPDSKVFYALTLPPSYSSTSIYQFDATLSTTAAIVASRTTVQTGSSDSQMKLGPDGKIYFVSISGSGPTNLDCIPSPNTLGTGCGYTSSAVTLLSGTNCVEGMPNIVLIGGNLSVSYVRRDTTFCIPTGDSAVIHPDSLGISYAWDNGDTSFNHFIHGPGTYIVAINRSCEVIYDTIVVQAPPASTFTFRHDTTVCALRAPITITDRAGLTGYTWNSGGSTRNLSVSATGVYYVVALDSCNNNYVDTFHVTLTPPDTTYTPTSDTSLCISFAPLNLNGGIGFTTYTWNSGSTASNISVRASGVYWVRKTTGCSVVIDTFRVHFIPFPAPSLGIDRFACIGDTIILSSVTTPNSTNLWNDGTTGDSLLVTTNGTYWLQVDNGCRTTDTINIIFSPRPSVNAGPDTTNCSGQPIFLKSLNTYSSPVYVWSNGANTDTTTVYTSGLYWLTVSVAGCSASDSIRVTIYNNSFDLANRDTAICAGKPVQALLTADPAATFQWLPTAGILFPNSSSPLIKPDTTTMYHVLIGLANCPVVSDSFLIDVQPYPTVYAGGNQSIC
ncbi:MAG: hypothetical protein EBZ77_08035, partial [Chitinophagia bacterium]|nr:hypothetical protein [Chitinophagia bacterium]